MVIFEPVKQKFEWAAFRWRNRTLDTGNIPHARRSDQGVTKEENCSKAEIETTNVVLQPAARTKGSSGDAAAGTMDDLPQ